MQIEIHPHALAHGFTVGQILNALRDPGKKKLETAMRARGSEAAYHKDGRVRYLAQDRPNGPMLHIMAVTSPGKLKVFECRRMSDIELRRYQKR